MVLINLFTLWSHSLELNSKSALSFSGDGIVDLCIVFLELFMMAIIAVQFDARAIKDSCERNLWFTTCSLVSAVPLLRGSNEILAANQE